MIHTFKPVMYGLCLLGLSACDSEQDIQIDNNNNVVNTALPERIRQVARLGTMPLEVRVTINDSDTVGQQVPNDTSNVQITANVPANQTNQIKVEWVALINDPPVLLADFTSSTQPNQENLSVSFYNDTGTRFDFDGDGLSNLQEARENRNLLDAIDLEVPLRTTFLGANRELIQGGADQDVSGDTFDPDINTTFSLRHDETNLVLYVCGQDEVLLGDGSVSPDGDALPEQYWHDDTVFLYLDGANSDNQIYDGIDDFQLAFVRSTEEMIISQGSQNQFCPADPQGNNCITHQFNPPGSNNSRCEYELVVTMPFAELNMTRGTEIGFDLEITDDDNGGRREVSTGFVGFEDSSDLDPSTFATIRLE